MNGTLLFTMAHPEQGPKPRPRDIIDTATRRRLAVAIPADERTIDKVLRGQPVRGDVGTRILAALAEIGIQP